MEITNGSSLGVRDAYTKGAGDVLGIGQGLKAKDGRKAGSGDRVDLSQKARDLGETRELYAQSPDIRQDKVDALRSQIENGTYCVDGNRVAWKMLRESLLNETA